MVTLRLAGPFAVERDGRPVPAVEVGSRKARTLLKVLAVERPRRLAVDRIATVLWPGRPPRQPAENVATLVSRLRGALGPGIVAGDRDGYQLGAAVTVDLDQAAARLDEARRRTAAGEPALAAAAARGALELLGDGEVLTDEAYADWAEPARTEAAALVQRVRETAAEAALALADPGTALGLAEAMTVADPYDEVGYRLLIRAETGLGRPARALAAYERLRDRLATDFGVDPAPQTRELQVAVLREQAPGRTSAVRGAPATGLPGRDPELSRLRQAWHRAAEGRPGLLLVTGEAGIGKTRLAAELATLAGATGGSVLAARCYETERSLFLQPLVEAIGQHAARARPALLTDPAADWADLAALVPEIATGYGHRPAAVPGSAEVARRRAYEAVCRYLFRLAGPSGPPVLLLLDDLHHAGLSTVELLHYLIRHAAGTRLLVVATVRAEEGAAALRALAEVADRVELGPLPTAAVEQLAAEAGHPQLAATILRRTRGHTLFVVETLRGLAAGDPGIPESLREAVLTRVERAGTGVAELLRVAAVLGAVIDPATLARMLDIPPAQATQRSEAALAARLLVVADRAYEFANDLVREVLYEAMPAPTRVAYHARAADLSGARPEAVAGHAAAAGDLARAARAWLVAGEEASRRYAGADALALLTSAVEAAERVGDLELTGRARLARGRSYDARRAYRLAMADYRAAAELARQAGDRRLEMMALRELAGDVPLALGMSIVDCTDHLRTGLRIAEGLGDRHNEADMLARLAVIAANRLCFTDAVGYGQRAVHAARMSNDDRAVAIALDGLKTAYAYQGDIGSLIPVLDELEPLLRRQGDLFRLQWAMLEGAIPAIAAGRWDAAIAQLSDAHAINRRSGYVAYEGWFVGYLGWLHRLRGDLDRALEYGQRALELTHGSTHAWWRAAACAQSAATLLAVGRTGEAVALLEEGSGLADRAGAESHLLACIGPLAEVTGSASLLEDADARLAQIQAPEGCAWLLGADAYRAVARAWMARGAPDRAAAVMAPLRTAARRAGWAWLDAGSEELGEVAGGPRGAVALHRTV